MSHLAKFLDKLIYRSCAEVARLSSFVIVLLAIFVLVSVVGRAFSWPVSIFFSLTIVCLIVFGLLSPAYTLGEGRHITVDVITERLPRNSRTGMEILGYLFCLAFSIPLLWQGAKWTLRSYLGGFTTFGEISFSNLDMPFWILPFMLVFGTFLVILQALRMIAKRSYSLKGEFRFLQFVLPQFIVLVLFGASILFAIKVNPLAGLFFALLTLLMSGIPVVFALGVPGVIGLFLFAGGARGLIQLPITAFSMVESYPLTSLPLFIIIGAILGEARLTEHIFTFLDNWFGRLRGSLLIVTVLTGAFFCAVTGSSIAATAILSMICLPPLLSRGFDKRLSAGVVAAGSVGSLIPPSIVLIVYGVLVEVSVGKLFIASILPAAVTFGMYIIYIIVLSFISREKFGKPSDPATWPEKFASLRRASLILVLPILVLGGIYAGITTATEAAGVAVVYGLLLIFITNRSALGWKSLNKGLFDGTVIASMMIYIMIGGLVFAAVVSQLRVGHLVVSVIQDVGLSTGGVILIMFIVLLVMGMFMPNAAIILTTLPIFFPLSQSLGIHPFWLGMLYVYCCEIGLLTPPVGLNLFMIQGVGKLKLQDVIIGNLPIVGILSLSILIIYIFPQLVEWLPSMMMG